MSLWQSVAFTIAFLCRADQLDCAFSSSGGKLETMAVRASQSGQYFSNQAIVRRVVISRPFSNLESIVRIFNSYGKFGGLLVRGNDVAGVGTTGRNTASADVTKPSPATPPRPRTGSPSSAIGPFAGKIVFRKGL
jgi:hypothetical protein